MELFKDKFLTITLEEGTSTLGMHWDGDPSPDEYKQGSNNLLDLLATNKTPNLWLNFRNLSSYLSLDDQVWTIHQWFPKIKEQQVRKVGVVVPKKMLTQIVIKSIFSGLPGSDLDVAFFDNPDDMKQWAS